MAKTKKERRGNYGNCAHCGEETKFAWVDTVDPSDSPIHVCVSCMNDAKVGYYVTPAYERVGQASYTPLLQPKPRKGSE